MLFTIVLQILLATDEEICMGIFKIQFSFPAFMWGCNLFNISFKVN